MPEIDNYKLRRKGHFTVINNKAQKKYREVASVIGVSHINNNDKAASAYK